MRTSTAMVFLFCVYLMTPAFAGPPVPGWIRALQREGTPVPALDASSGWAGRRQAILAKWRRFLGRMAEPRCALKPAVVETETVAGGIQRNQLTLQVEPGIRMACYLFVPPGDGPFPACVCLHSTSKETIRQSAGLGSAPEKAFALDLARRGYITLAPENFLWYYPVPSPPENQGGIYHARTRAFQARHPGVKGMAKMIHDAGRCVDYLETLPKVDKKNIGAIGHSLGAKEVAYLMAFDRRVACGVSSEGGVAFEFTNYHDPWYLGPDILKKETGLHAHEVIALIAPRPWLLIGGNSADGDKSWPCLARVLPVYQQLGRPDGLGLFVHDKGHAMPPEARRAAFRWLDYHLKGEGRDFSPDPDERQLPKAMHSAMEALPIISVGQEKADIIGRDSRALQAAVDYIAGLGGGTVQVKKGRYLMRDALHLRSHVKVVGEPGLTILRKADGAVSALALDGDFGEEQITLKDPAGFEVGHGVAVWDDRAGGFHTTTARITGRRGNTFSLDRPLMADCLVSRNARAATVFPVVSGYHIEGARIEHVTIEGNKAANVLLNGCRGAGIFLYRGFGTVIKNCVVRNYNGDGISFQQSNDVSVLHCTVEDNAQLGLHPGSGSQRPEIRHCVARRNGTDGLFLCWRVRHGVFEGNLLEVNGRFGISIGHKDSDNLLHKNIIRGNGRDGIFFRNESLGMGAHRNRLVNNIIENNGASGEAAGIRIRGQTRDLVFKGNRIRDTREKGKQTQTIGIIMEAGVGAVVLEENVINAETRILDKRAKPDGE